MSAKPESEAIPPRAASAGAFPDRAWSTSEEARILLVQPSNRERTRLVEALTAQGHDVLTAEGGQDGIDLLTASPIGVAVLQAHGSLTEPLGVVQRIRLTSPDTKVVLLVDDVPAEDLIAALRAGVFDVLREPASVPDLVATVARALQERGHARGSDFLFKEAQALFSIHERERLPEVIVNLIRKVMDADVVSLMLPDTNGRLYIAHAHGLPDDLQASVRLHPGEQVAGRIALLRAPVLLTDALTRDRRFADLAPSGRVRSSVVYPLVSGDRLVGVINIGRTAAFRPFAESDLERARAVASHILLALENLRLWRHIGMAERMVTIGQITASVVHEINNPLAAVLGHNYLAQESLNELQELLQQSQATSSTHVQVSLTEIRRCLTEVQSAAKSIQAVAEDVRSASQRDADNSHIFDVSDVVQGAIRLAAGELRKHASVVKQLPPNLLVTGDHGQLCQVFLNLLLNASQALRVAQAPNPEIRLVASRVGPEIRVDVQDNGPGIPPENLARVFEPFFTTKNAQLGTGLGLTISNEIVQRYGGRIEVCSKVGAGTCFSVFLPGALPSEQPGDRPEPGARAAGSAGN